MLHIYIYIYDISLLRVKCVTVHRFTVCSFLSALCCGLINKRQRYCDIQSLLWPYVRYTAVKVMYRLWLWMESSLTVIPFGCINKLELMNTLEVPHSGHYVYRTVVTICIDSLTFNNSTFSPQSVFMCFVWIWEQTAIISLYSINWLVGFYNWDGVCLLRGTFYVLPTQCVYVFCVDLSTNSDYFTVHR